MKKLLTIFLTVGLLIISITVQAASLHDYPTVGILPYVNKAAVSAELSIADASIISDIVLEKLVDSGRFKVVERERTKEVLNEIAFQLGGVVSENTIVQIGNQLGASYLVAGSITGLSTKKSGISYEHSMKGGGNFNKMTVVANVTMRFIDVETGQIVMVASGTGESARTNAEFTLKRKTEEEYETTTTDESGIEMPTEGTDISTLTQTLKIGGMDFSLVQVRNAFYWAVEDMIYNKKFGLLAKLDGTAKRRKV